jgi:Tol biopolymer transport system component
LNARRLILSTCACAISLLPAFGLSGCGKSSTSPRVQPLGRHLLAYASDRNGTFDIFLYDLDGLTQYSLPGLNSATAAERRPSIGADAQVLAFVTDRGTGMGDLDILIYDLVTSQLAATPAINSAGREDEPAFTGNALSLLFVRDTLGVRRIRFFNGVSDRFVPLPGIDAPPGFSDWAPAPDITGARTAFVSDRNGNPDVFVYDATGDSLLDLPDLVSDSTDTEPALTPDGRFLAFASTRTGGAGGFDLYLYDLQMKMFIPLVAGVNTAMNERHPTLSSSAAVISFESDRTDGIGGFDVWNHSRSSGTTGQGANQSSTTADVEPSMRWP